MLIHQNHAAGEENGSIMVGSLAVKYVPAGTKHSRSEGFLLVKHLKHTAHKHHHHHDGAISPSSAMV